MPAKPSDSQLENIAQRCFAANMISAEASRLGTLSPGPLFGEPEPPGMDPETYEIESLGGLKRQRDAYDEIIEILGRNITFNQFHDIRAMAETLLKEDGIDFETDDDTTRRLSALLLRADLVVNMIMRSRANGKYYAVSDDPLFPIDLESGNPSKPENLIGPSTKITPKKRGRPAVEIETLRAKLFDLRDSGKLPAIEHGWRTAVARSLLDYHKSEFPDNKLNDATTIVTRLKKYFDQIENGNVD